MTAKKIILFPLMFLLVASCFNATGPSESQTGANGALLAARWQRDGVCGKLGVAPWNNFWFRADTFEFACQSCGFCDSSFTEFPASTRGAWRARGDTLILLSGSPETELRMLFSVRPAADPAAGFDSLILTSLQGIKTVYRKVPTAFPVDPSCGGMIFMAKIGNDFGSAADSLLRRQWEYATSHLVYDSTRTTGSIRDTLGRPYLVPCYQVCIYKDAYPNMIHSCGDVIDSLGNWFVWIFCPD
jgi:hypothetical protein